MFPAILGDKLTQHSSTFPCFIVDTLTSLFSYASNATVDKQQCLLTLLSCQLKNRRMVDCCMVVPSLVILDLKPMSSSNKRWCQSFEEKSVAQHKPPGFDSATRWNTLWLFCWSICTTAWKFGCRGIHFFDELNSIVGEEASEDTRRLETEPGIHREASTKARICDATASFNKYKIISSRATHGKSTWPNRSLLCRLVRVLHTIPPFLHDVLFYDSSLERNATRVHRGSTAAKLVQKINSFMKYFVLHQDVHHYLHQSDAAVLRTVIYESCPRQLNGYYDCGIFAVAVCLHLSEQQLVNTTVLYMMNRVITACTRTNFAMSKIWTKRWQQCRDDGVVKAHLCKWWPALGMVISDAMCTCLFNDAVIGAEMMKINAIKVIMNMVDFCGSTPRGKIHSVEERWCRRRELEMDDIGINMDYIVKVAKRHGLY